MDWSLFVDTDSLYIETRRRFGIDARIDYLSLPLNIVRQLQDIKFFREKIAMVMRHGKEWPSFVNSLERFGYNIIPTDRGMQSITVAAQLLEMLEKVSGIVIVTASARIMPVITKLAEQDIHLCVVSFDKCVIHKEKNREHNVIDTLIMDNEWLWKNCTKEL